MVEERRNRGELGAMERGNGAVERETLDENRNWLEYEYEIRKIK